MIDGRVVALLCGLFGVSACAAPTHDAPGQKAQAVVNASVPSLKLHTGSVAEVGSDSWTVVNLPETFTSMVVVATPLYGPSDSPIVTRVRNAAGASFELQVARMDGDSSAVVPVPVQYVVVEEGVYTEAANGVNLEAVRFDSTVTDRKGSWTAEARDYANGYTQPVVLGQVLSANDPSPSVFWSRGLAVKSPASSSALFVGKHVGEDPSTARADETVGYIVVEAGSYSIDGVALEAGLGADSARGLNSSAGTYAIGNAGALVNAVLSQSAMDGNNGSWAVLQSINADSLTVSVDEDQFKDSERSHTTEQLAYLTVNPCAGASAAGSTCGEGGTCTGYATCVDVSSCSTSSTGEGVLEGDLVIDGVDTAGDLAQLDGVWCVAGSLTVTGVDWTDMEPLSGLLGVGLAMQVSQNASLTSLSGLDGLSSAFQLKLYANPVLESLAGLESFASGASLELAGNSALASLDGLGPVDLSSSIWLSGNGNLQNVDALQSVSGSLASGLTIQGESSITSLAGLSNITSVGSVLRIIGADSLTSLAGLEGMTSVGGELLVRQNDVLPDLDGLSGLASVGSARIYDNPALDGCHIQELMARTGIECTDCVGNIECADPCYGRPAGYACGEDSNCTPQGACVDGTTCASWTTGEGVLSGSVIIDETDTEADLAQLDDTWCVTGGLTVKSTGWTDLSAISHILGVGGALTIQSEAGLTSLSGLENLARVQKLWLIANHGLADLSGTGLRSGGSLELTSNSGLTSLDGLPLVDWNWIWLTGNGSIQNLDALAGVSGYVSSLGLQNEFALESIAGLAGMTSVGGTVRILRANGLTSLAGLEALESIGGELSLSENAQLGTIAELSSLTSIASARIANNPLLSECAALDLVDRLGSSCTDCSGNVACAEGSECEAPSCDGQSCGLSPLPAGTSCSLGECDGAGLCQELVELCPAGSEGQPCGQTGTCTGSLECFTETVLSATAQGTWTDEGNDGSWDDFSTSLLASYYYDASPLTKRRRRTALEFDVSAIPANADITTAILRLTKTSAVTPAYTTFPVYGSLYEGDGAIDPADMDLDLPAFFTITVSSSMLSNLIIQDLESSLMTSRAAGEDYFGVQMRTGVEGVQAGSSLSYALMLSAGATLEVYYYER